ncbi:MAG: FG-GAP-like repeat-containing protein [Candidatus Polarisedimenticolia bacterium]
MLSDIVRRADPFKNQFMNEERAAAIRAMLGTTKDPGQRIEMVFRLAEELLYSGRTREAMALAMPLLNPPPQFASLVPPERVMREFLAVAHMRIGEQDNCIAHHGIDSCLLPIKGSGVHADQRGSRAAISELTSLLQEDPANLDLRWLLNIAYMTVGEWPDKVPEALLIPPSVFEAEYDVGRFYDVAPRAGLAVRGRAGGGIMEDFNGDGLLDVMVSAQGMSDQMRLFISQGDGRFDETTERAGLIGEIGGLNLVSADYDNDGAVDILVLRGAWLRKGGHIPNSLLRNNGDGTFEDVTEQAGLLSFRPTQAAAWGDYDNDGRLDLFVGNESSAEDRHPSELYHNNGDGTFTNRIGLLGTPDLGFVKGAAWGDIDNDGRADLYVSAGDGPNKLFHNRGPGPDGAWLFEEISARAGVTAPHHSFATWFWDYDNDGWEDIYVSGYSIDGTGDAAAMYLGLPRKAEVPRLYHNNRDGTFTDMAPAARLDRVALVMGANFGDLDNDGWLDCYLGTGNPRLEMLLPNRMFRNDGGKTFQDVTTSGGFGHLQKGHAVAFGDIDNDGDQDVFEQMGGAYPGDVSQNALYENPGHGGHWVTLDLVGRTSNRYGVGARIKVSVDTPGGPRDIFVTAGNGGSFGSNSLRQEIGLGDARAISSIEIRWPASGLRQVLRGTGMDRAWRVVEGENEPLPIKPRRFDLSPA